MTFLDHGILHARTAFAIINGIVPLLQEFAFPLGDVEGMQDADWQQVARCASVANPDAEVRRMIVDKLRELRGDRK